jgi:hypothetical protein
LKNQVRWVALQAYIDDWKTKSSEMKQKSSSNSANHYSKSKIDGEIGE